MNDEVQATFATGPESHLAVDLQSKAMDLESGCLGKAFGNQVSTPPTSLVSSPLALSLLA
jgi:hypothetical protein